MCSEDIHSSVRPLSVVVSNRTTVYFPDPRLHTVFLTYWFLSSVWLVGWFFSSPEPKAQVSYCHSAPSVVRLSVCPSSINFSHFRLLLQNHLMDFDETWWGWSTHGPLQVLLFFGQIRPGADPGRGKNRSPGIPFFKKLLLQTGWLHRYR